MSEKWTSRIAVCCIIGIVGILIAAIVPDTGHGTDFPVIGTGEGTSESIPQDDGIKNGSAEDAQGGAGFAARNLYYYNALSDEEQVVYQQMYDSILAREDVALETLDESWVDKVFQCVLNDHPDIFFCSAYRIEKQMRNGQTVRITFSPQYHMTEEEVQENWEKIRAYVEQCRSGISDMAGEYEKVKYVYEYIIQNTKYTPNSDNNQNICSVCIGGESVCQGYAKTAQYILSGMGIEITLAYGNVGGELHSWNLVRVDDEYYYMDPTWGDAGYVRPAGSSGGIIAETVNYEYFLITSEQIGKTHEIDNVVPLPACVATRNNYYIREGLYFAVYDEARLDSMFKEAQDFEKDCVTFMCADKTLYGEMKNKLITEQGVFRYINSSKSVSYSYNDGLYTLIFWIE